MEIFVKRPKEGMPALSPAPLLGIFLGVILGAFLGQVFIILTENRLSSTSPAEWALTVIGAVIGALIALVIILLWRRWRRKGE
jgi:uncharacterized membrane protein YeaQ/YmgE (transglycosylase-associated protein family)